MNRDTAAFLSGLLIGFVFGAIIVLHGAEGERSERSEEAIRKTIGFLNGTQEVTPAELGLVYKANPELYDLAWDKIMKANENSK